MSESAVCRLCTRVIADDGHDIAGRILKQINKLLPIIVLQWDPLPRSVCTTCLVKLDLFDQFYESSLRAEKKLRLESKLDMAEFKTDVLTENLKFEPFTYGHHLKHVITNVTVNKNLKEMKHFITISNDEKSPQVEKCDSMDVGQDDCVIIQDIQRPDMSKEKVINCMANIKVTRISGSMFMYVCVLCSNTYTTEQSAREHVCTEVENMIKSKELEEPDDSVKPHTVTVSGNITEDDSLNSLLITDISKENSAMDTTLVDSESEAQNAGQTRILQFTVTYKQDCSNLGTVVKFHKRYVCSLCKLSLVKKSDMIKHKQFHFGPYTDVRIRIKKKKIK